MKRCLRIPFLLLAAFCFSAAQAQQIDTTMWGANGKVRAIARWNNTVYLGGEFTRIGPTTGGGAALNVSDAKLATISVPHINGEVNAAIADGKGGWFIGGTFDQVQGVARNNLAHLLADGTLDPAWSPVVEGPVFALALGDQVVYVGGNFTTANGQYRSHAAAVDVTTGGLTAWHPLPSGTVVAIAVWGNQVCLAGDFYSIGSYHSRSHLATVDATTGQVTGPDFRPLRVDLSMSVSVNALAIAGNILYVGGSFTHIGGEPRRHLAAFDLTTGLPTGWDPAPDREVWALAAAGNQVYVGGEFYSVGGQSRRSLAALDATTSQATAWNPGPHYSVRTIAVAGNLVYAGGTPITIIKSARSYLAAFDATTGLATDWDPAPDGGVRTLAVSAQTVYAGGDFHVIGGQTRKFLAAVDATTGQLTAWDPKPDSTVTTLVAEGGVVYALGDFHKMNGKFTRGSLAAFDATTGQLTDWNPNPDGRVRALVISDNTVYLGGQFYSVGGQPKNHLAAVDLKTGQPTAWRPRLDGPVNAIAVSPDAIYAAGDFHFAGNEPRRYLAAFDVVTGRPTAFYPRPSGQVTALAVSGDTLYACGDFLNMNSKGPGGLAAVNRTTGEVLAWNSVGRDVYAMTLVGNTLYLGGRFELWFGENVSEPRTALASVDAATGRLTDWNPNGQRSLYKDFTYSVDAITVWRGVVYAGGNFTGIGNRVVSRFAAFGKATYQPNHIRGTVFRDDNGDCVQNAGEKGLAGVIVVARPGDYFASTDSAGQYTLTVETGDYSVAQVIPADQTRFLTQTCPADPATHAVRFTGSGDTLTGKNFGNRVNLLPQLEVSVASTRRRRCFSATTTVSYANTGTAPATGAKVYVQLPEYVILKSASVPFTRDQNGTYLFEAGALAPGTRHSIHIEDSVSCGNPAIRGLTQCTKAWITPAHVPATANGWDRSDLTLTAACRDNGNVRLGIFNAGAGGMADSSTFRVLLDAQLAFTGRYKLAPGDSLILKIPAHGRTVRLEADQRPNHPVKAMTSISLEACGTKDDGTVSRGFVAQFPADDPEPEVAIECLPIVDSFDPNDKAVTPRGVGAQHYTPTRAALDYVIRFQNTGTDVAYKVVVVDTLVAELDVSTLQVGAVSHPYRLRVTGKGRPVLTFTFDNINLPDSTRDKAGSNGAIAFRIRPKENLPPSTRVENFADIFFDYNEPIRTNTTVNTFYDIPPVVEKTVKLDQTPVCANTNTAVGAGSSQTLCWQTTEAVLQATHPAYGKGRWQRISGSGTIPDAQHAVASVTGLGYGANVFAWSIAANTCGTDSLSARVTITRLLKPATPAVVRQGTDGLACSVAGSGYEWFLDGAKLEPSAQAIAVTRTGNYTVRVKDGQGCWSEESSAFFHTITAIEPVRAPAVRVYPNPTGGIVFIELPAFPGGRLLVSVYNAQGQKLFEQSIAAGSTRTSIDLSTRVAGLYLVKIQTPDGMIVRRVFKKQP